MPYLDFDLFNPEQQSFPASTVEVAAAGFSSNVLAGWACQETGGTTLADFSGNGHTLTKAGSGAHIGQRATGLFDGSGFRNQRAFELVRNGASNYAELASGASLDMDWTTPWSVLIVFRGHGKFTGALFNKGTGFVAGHWSLYVDVSGLLLATVHDGTLDKGISRPMSHMDGGWHWAYARWDPTDNTLKLDTDLAPDGSVSTVGMTSAVSNPSAFKLGEWAGAAEAHPVQIRGCIVFGDCDTTVASIRSWWRHGRAPNWLTYSRASSFHDIIADDATEGDVVAGWASGQMAYGYSSLVSTNPLKLGASSDAAHTNLIPYSDVNDATNWATSGGTRANHNADSVRGFREASRHAKTAGADKVLAAVANGAAVTAASVYTASVWCRLDTGGGLTPVPELRVYRADGTTLIGTASATVSTSRWHRLSYTFTAPATESVRIAWSGAAAAATSGSAWFACPQVNTDDYAKPYVHTTGATASTVVISAYGVVPGLTADRGTVKAWHTCRDSTSDLTLRRYIFAARANDGTHDEGVITFVTEGASSGPVVQYYNEGAILLAEAAGATPGDVSAVELVCVVQWDKDARSGWTLRTKVNAATAGTSAATIAAAAGMKLERVYMGSASPGNSVNGLVSKVRVWRGVELPA
ncbi:MAG: hypothetical protein M3R63_18530 [Actinomycetota bacterium]|nr:hypothetical protein [Actinomycetota bacterium]